MHITKYEQLLLEDLKRSRGTKKRKLVLDVTVALTGLTGFLILIIVYSNFQLITIISGLCGGLLGASIERLYTKKISTLAMKLYKLYNYRDKK